MLGTALTKVNLCGELDEEDGAVGEGVPTCQEPDQKLVRKLLQMGVRGCESAVEQHVKVGDKGRFPQQCCSLELLSSADVIREARRESKDGRSRTELR